VRLPEPLTTFETGVVPEQVYEVDLLGTGPERAAGDPRPLHGRLGPGPFYHDYFVTKHRRNPTIVEIMDLNNANSEHSRHGYFRGRLVIDGVEQPESLMGPGQGDARGAPARQRHRVQDKLQAPFAATDRDAAARAAGAPSPLVRREATYHVIFTAETHNFPTGVAPFPGAETGTGGRIRDVQGTGRGGFVVAGTAAYCVGNLLIPGYSLPWEEALPRPGNIATRCRSRSRPPTAPRTTATSSASR